MLHPCCCRGTSRGLAEFMRSKQSCPRTTLPAARRLCHHRNAKQPQPCHSGSLGLHCSWELSRAETFILMPISPCILPYPFLTHLHHLSHRPHVCFFYTIHPHPSSNQPTVHYHRLQCMEPGSIVTSMAAAATLKARALKEIWNVAASVTAEAAPDRKHNGSALL